MTRITIFGYPESQKTLYPKNLKEEFEDTKGVIRIHISKKNRQHNGQKKMDKQRSIKHTHKRANKIYVLIFIVHFH